MEPLLSMKTASVLLALTAVGGIWMAAMRLRKRNPPAWLAMGHGFLAASAVTILAYAWYTVGLPGMASIALLLFVLAALGGVIMNLNFHWKALPLPVGLMFGHAALAVLGFVLLLIATFG